MVLYFHQADLQLSRIGQAKKINKKKTLGPTFPKMQPIEQMDTDYVINI